MRTTVLGVEAVGVVRRIAQLLGSEGAALISLGLIYAVVSATSRPENRLGAELAAMFVVVLGGVVLLLARATSAGRTWPRTPAVVINAIALPVGLGLLQGHLYLAGVLVLLPAVTLLWLYATPEARERLRES